MALIKIPIKLYYDASGNLYTEGNKNVVPFIYKLSNLTYRLILVTPVGCEPTPEDISPGEDQTITGYSFQAFFRKGDGTQTDTGLPLAYYGTETVDGETWLQYATDLPNDILNVSSYNRLNTLGISFYYSDGDLDEPSILNTQPFYAKCNFSVTGNQGVIEDTPIDQLQRAIDVALSTRALRSDTVLHVSALPTIVTDSNAVGYNVGWVYMLDTDYTYNNIAYYQGDVFIATVVNNAGLWVKIASGQTDINTIETDINTIETDVQALENILEKYIENTYGVPLLPEVNSTNDGKYLVIDFTNSEVIAQDLPIVDNLNSTSSAEILSANQGRVLNNSISAISETVNGHGTTIGDIIDGDQVVGNATNAVNATNSTYADSYVVGGGIDTEFNAQDSRIGQNESDIDDLQQYDQTLTYNIGQANANITALQNSKLDKIWTNIALGSNIGADDYFVLNSGGVAYKVTTAQMQLIFGGGGGTDHYKGDFASLEALQTAYPTASAGDYAFVLTTAEEETTMDMYVWDNTDGEWEATGTGGQYVTTSTFATFQQSLLDGTFVVSTATNYYNSNTDSNVNIEDTINGINNNIGALSNTVTNNIGKLNQISFNATYSAPLITAVAEQTWTLNHNTKYAIDIVLPVSVASGLLPYETQLVLTNGNDTIRINGVFNRNGAVNATFGQLLGVMDNYNNSVGFRWTFEATYKVSGTNKTFEIAPTIDNHQDVVVVVPNDIMLDSITASSDSYGCFALSQIATPSDNDGYTQGSFYQYVNTGTTQNPIYSWNEISDSLVQATSTILGGIKAPTKESTDTTPVRIDTATGNLYVYDYPNIIFSIADLSSITSSEETTILAQVRNIVVEDGNLNFELTPNFNYITIQTIQDTSSNVTYLLDNAIVDAQGDVVMTFTVDADTDYVLTVNLSDNTITGVFNNISITIDSAVSTSSTNAVQNQAITTYVNGLQPYVISNTVPTWVSDSTYADYAYRGSITISGLTSSSYVEVVFSLDQVASGNYAPVCATDTNVVYVYSKVNTSITIPTILVVIK